MRKSKFRAKGRALGVIYIFICLFAIAARSEAYRIVGDSSVAVYWTAPGDDSKVGQAAEYDFRISTTRPGIDIFTWWENAQRVTSTSYPSFAGRIDSCVISGISFHRVYYFALKTADDAGNWSELSNIGIFPNLDCADVNGDRSFNLIDAAYILAYFYNEGPEPVDYSGDIDNSGLVNIVDAAWMVKYFFEIGALPPCCAAF